MDDKDKASQNSTETSSSAPPSKGVEAVNPEATSPATAQQLKNVENEMTGFEKATLKWARTAVIMSALAAAFVCLQWVEMCKGGKDTSTLAQQAVTQATQTTHLATATENTRKDSVRPWLSIDNTGDKGITMSAPITFKNKGDKAVFSLLYRVQNTGHSPASIQVLTEQFDNLGDHPDSRTFQQVTQDLCKRAEDRLPAGAWVWTIVPGNDFVWAVTTDDIQSKSFDVGSKDSIQPETIGCILYRSIEDVAAGNKTPPYRTSFIGQISQRDEKGKKGNCPAPGVHIPIDIRSRKDIPAGKLCVHDVFIIGDAN